MSSRLATQEAGRTGEWRRNAFGVCYHAVGYHYVCSGERPLGWQAESLATEEPVAVAYRYRRV